MDQEHRKVLQLVAEGVIGADEGLLLLETLSNAESLDSDAHRQSQNLSQNLPTTIQKNAPFKPAWAALWPLVFGFGVFLATLGGVYSFMVLSGQMMWLWIFFTVPLLGCGAIIALFGWLMVTCAWLRVKIKDDGTNINLSFPIPLHWIAALIRIARPWVPQLQEVVTDDILEIIADSIQETDFNIEVQEANGQHVLVSYG
ncbi:MAG: hypothetical protein AAF629_31510 [Chloroflexota bacterium]